MTGERMKAMPVIELDLSGPRPVVLVDGKPLHGVSSAILSAEAFETPVLVLRLVRFDVIGGSLPAGMAQQENR
jgi:hypothetical protein